LEYHPVVTSFLSFDQQILLLRRSEKVGTHRGRWSAISGYLEGDEQPLTRALIEIKEELEVDESQICLIRSGEILRAYDEETDTVWVIHPFLFETKSQRVQLNWENTEYVWVDPSDLASYSTVPKLKETFDRVRRDLLSSPTTLGASFNRTEEFSTDRVHGASFLGRRAIDILSTTCSASEARDKDELFYELLLIAQRLRKSQPCMASVWNLVGSYLFLIDRERSKASTVSQLKDASRTVAEKIVENSKDASENAARYTARAFPNNVRVLTHSYSNAVLRSLELGVKGGKIIEVYATESYPGLEGKQFAHDLLKLSVQVKSISDSAVDSVIPTVDLVLVGSDSVLRDGSLVHKVGTEHIAALAHDAGVIVRSTCETMKFSALDFLGERPRVGGVFDLTPREYVSDYATELGLVNPTGVEERIRNIVEQVYP